MAGRLALSVSQLNEYVRRLLQQDPLLREIELKGEISNLKIHQTGTLFFTLKDEQAAVACVMYASDVLALGVEPFEGMQALVTGSVGLYAKGGQYQFYARSIRAQGMGVLYERYQALREKLTAEGLFDRARKKPLPLLADTVGVVSSPTGAVIHDILSVSLRRNPQARILLCPVRVQGAGAADEIVRALSLLDRMENISVIVLARGGGSMEDLWTFNEERVVRAVAACRKPVVSAIGHETDVTLCDFAADMRAPTPSAAAECVTLLRGEAEERLVQLRSLMVHSVQSVLERRAADLARLRAQLAAVHPGRTIDRAQAQCQSLREAMRHILQAHMADCEHALQERKHALYLLSPYAVLARGYAIVLREGKPVVSAMSLNEGDCVELLLGDSRAGAMITSVENRPSVCEEVTSS